MSIRPIIPPMSSTAYPATEWTKRDEERAQLLLAELDVMLIGADGVGMSTTGVLMHESLSEVCNPLLNPARDRREYWYPYRNDDQPMSAFFRKWLYYAPRPADPGFYIEQWDYLANTKAGLKLNNADQRFKTWFVNFLNLRGDWLSSTDSAKSISEWMQYKGTKDHPFNIDEYIVPPGGFKSFNQFFLRELKPDTRPMCTCDDAGVIVAPCDGGVFYLTRGVLEGESYSLPGKSQDTFQIEQAIPGYGGAFLGGPMLDILLWFTDYHHFRAPVSGTIIHQGVYEGSYNYDFDNYDPNDPYAPALPADSDRVGWYQSLGKHKRYVWIFRTEDLGLVAMMAIGFWGVGSIINEVAEGATLNKGDRMGHFGYGGSSIVLAFEPNLDLQFGVKQTVQTDKELAALDIEVEVGDLEVEVKVDVEDKHSTELTKPVNDADHPTLMQIQQCLGRKTPPLKWP